MVRSLIQIMYWEIADYADTIPNKLPPHRGWEVSLGVGLRCVAGEGHPYGRVAQADREIKRKAQPSVNHPENYYRLGSM